MKTTIKFLSLGFLFFFLKQVSLLAGAEKLNIKGFELNEEESRGKIFSETFSVKSDQSNLVFSYNREALPLINERELPGKDQEELMSIIKKLELTFPATREGEKITFQLRDFYTGIAHIFASKENQDLLDQLYEPGISALFAPIFCTGNPLNAEGSYELNTKGDKLLLDPIFMEALSDAISSAMQEPLLKTEALFQSFSKELSEAPTSNFEKIEQVLRLGSGRIGLQLMVLPESPQKLELIAKKADEMIKRFGPFKAFSFRSFEDFNEEREEQEGDEQELKNLIQENFHEESQKLLLILDTADKVLTIGPKKLFQFLNIFGTIPMVGSVDLALLMILENHPSIVIEGFLSPQELIEKSASKELYDTEGELRELLTQYAQEIKSVKFIQVAYKEIIEWKERKEDLSTEDIKKALEAKVEWFKAKWAELELTPAAL